MTQSLIFAPGHLKPVIIKPVGSKSATRTRYGENAENAESPSAPQKNKGLGGFTERKMRKMRMTGFNVIGFR